MNEYTRLLDIVKKLRNPIGGCPWDIKQTPKSLVPNFIEEVYEAIEAIENEDSEHLKEELGDVMLHIVMQAQIQSEKNNFTLEQSLKHINDKLVSRHPHVFGSEEKLSSEKVKLNWERIKQKQKAHRKSVLDGIPKKMPALIVAWRIQEKAASVGFDWKEVKPIYDKIIEETAEFKQAVEQKDIPEMENELGDLLFSVVNLARHYKIDAEAALRKTIDKFENRFHKIEEHHKQNDLDIYESTLDELDELWNKVK